MRSNAYDWTPCDDPEQSVFCIIFRYTDLAHGICEINQERMITVVYDVCRHCRKVLPLAEAAYSEGLPPTYTLAYHTTKVLVVTLIRIIIVMYNIYQHMPTYLHIHISYIHVLCMYIVQTHTSFIYGTILLYIQKMYVSVQYTKDYLKSLRKYLNEQNIDRIIVVI